MTRIVFASCISVEASSEQPVWEEAIAHEPDWLVLCGDNIYMDYFPNLYQSRRWKPDQFAREMHTRYARQFEVPSFRALVESLPAHGRVVGAWDDHDFAWNNCFGTDPDDDMPIKRRIATALYHHYFGALNLRPLPEKLPAFAMPDPANPPGGRQPTYGSTRIGPLHVLLCDGRSFREDNTSGTGAASLLGVEQEEWLFGELTRSSGPFLLVTGSTMTAGDDQSWDCYREFFDKRFLPAVKGKTVIFLAGDVHENRLPPRTPDWPVEVVSSAAVLDFPFNKRNYGLIEVSDAEASIFLYKRGRLQYTGRINLATNTYRTTMAALMPNRPLNMAPQEAHMQRREALEMLDDPQE